ncbi:MAG: hypothetical protein ABEI86_10605, partial [Halobacteriaceae archaeon]
SAVLVAVMVIMGAVGIYIPIISGTTGGFIGGDHGNNKTDILPGVRFTGVVNIQHTELQGNVEKRSFAIQLRKADSPSEKAAIIAEKVKSLQQQITNLQERKQTLKNALQNGSISKSEYRAEIAELVSQINNVRQMVNKTVRVAKGLPTELLAAKGINVSAIVQLKNHAANMSGQEIAAIARSIRGSQGNKSKHEHKHPPHEHSKSFIIKTISRAEKKIHEAEQVIEEAPKENKQVAKAKDLLQRAKTLLEEAKTAKKKENGMKAIRLAQKASKLAQKAIQLVQTSDQNGGTPDDPPTTTTGQGKP